MALKRVAGGLPVALRELSHQFNTHIHALKNNGQHRTDCSMHHCANYSAKDGPNITGQVGREARALVVCQLNTTVKAYGYASAAEMPNHGNFNFPMAMPLAIRCSLIVTIHDVPVCEFCATPRYGIYNCFRIVNLDPALRLREANRLDLCLNCLKKGHQFRSCSSGCLRTCGAKHHSLLPFNSYFPYSQLTAISYLLSCLFL